MIGSYPQPDWLIDRQALGSRLPPRVRAKELWRVDEEFLAQAQDDATIVAIRDMERSGLDTITGGEIRRESYSNHFATALDGVDVDNPGTAIDRSAAPNPVPRVVGPVRRRHAVNLRHLEFLRASTDLPVTITVPGPFTMTQQAQDDHYGDDHALALDYAAAVNAELLDLQAAGADVIQLDEPYLQPRAQQAERYGLERGTGAHGFRPPDRGTGLRHEVPSAGGGAGKAACPGGRRGDRPRGTGRRLDR